MKLGDPLPTDVLAQAHVLGRADVLGRANVLGRADVPGRADVLGRAKLAHQPDLQSAPALLVHFWSTGCPLCHEGTRDIALWREHFSADLAVVGIYQPRYTFDRTPVDAPNRRTLDRDEIEQDADELMRIDYPNVIDEDGSLTRRFGSEFPPSYYVFDRERKLRHRQMGNANLAGLAGFIERLVKA